MARRINNDKDITALVNEFGITRQNACFKLGYYAKTGRNAAEEMRKKKKRAEELTEQRIRRDANTKYYSIKDGAWVRVYEYEVEAYLKDK